jgi:hypothetical protein
LQRSITQRSFIGNPGRDPLDMAHAPGIELDEERLAATLGDRSIRA